MIKLFSLSYFLKKEEFNKEKSIIHRFNAISIWKFYIFLINLWLMTKVTQFIKRYSSKANNVRKYSFSQPLVTSET